MMLQHDLLTNSTDPDGQQTGWRDRRAYGVDANIVWDQVCAGEDSLQCLHVLHIDSFTSDCERTVRQCYLQDRLNVNG